MHAVSRLDHQQRPGRSNSVGSVGRSHSKRTLDWLQNGLEQHVPSLALSTSPRSHALDSSGRRDQASVVSLAGAAKVPAVNPYLDEDPQQTIDRLGNMIDSLRIELNERQWATQRAAELGAALDAVVEENRRLNDECGALKSRVAELESLRGAQRVLLAVMDGGIMDPAQVQRLLARSDTFRESCEELQNACRSVAKWGPSSCPACLAAREERSRNELVLKERASWQAMQSAFDALFAAQRYCTVQYSEVETERMWQEDMLAHRLSALYLQQEVSKYRQIASRVPLLEDEARRWKDQCADLTRRTEELIESTEKRHQQALRDAKSAAMRAAPQMSLLKFLLVSNLKSFHAHGNLMFFVSVLRKHLLLMQHEMKGIARAFVTGMKSLHLQCVSVVSRCTVQDWSPVPQEPSRREAVYLRDVHPPVLSAYARNAIVHLPKSDRAASAARSASSGRR